MTPSLRRCILAVALVGGCVQVSETRAQEASSPRASAKAAPTKAAANKPAEPKAAKADPAAAQAEVENGINALGQGRVDAAVASLTSALSASSLPQTQTARALYYRGVAYRRQAKPAQAISDLTNALWIKSGLTEEQRQDALQQRSGAYREAGLPDQSGPATQRAATSPKAGSASTPFASVAPPQPATGSSTTLTSSGGGFFSSLFGGSSAAPEPATAAKNEPPVMTASVTPRAAPPVAAKGAVLQPIAPLPAQTEGLGEKPATRMVPVLNAASNLPTGFQEIGEPIRMVEVSTQVRAPEPEPAPVSAAPVAGVKIKAGTSAHKDAAKASAKAVAATPAAAPLKVATAAPSVVRPAGGGSVPAPKAGASGVRIQVAAVRTEEEAQGVSAKLQAQYGRELGGRAPVVDQVSAGNFGNFYRVQVGPFAPTRETEQLCEKFRTGGLDCRLVSQ